MDELPPPHWTMTSGGMEAWNADQMREYGRAREWAAYERAANRAMQFAKVLKEVAAHNACVLLADSIRALGDDK